MKESLDNQKYLSIEIKYKLINEDINIMNY